MSSNLVDMRGLTIVAAKFKGKVEGEVDGTVTSGNVTVAAGDNGLSAGTLQEVLQDIYDILDTKADAGG